MAITIRILKQVTVSPGGSFPDTITAEFAIQNDAVNSTWYRWSRGGIPSNTADVQAFLDAEGASLYTEAAANNNQMTPDQVTDGVYAWQHYAYRDIFAHASTLIGEANFFNGNLAPPNATNPTLAQTRTDLAAAQTYLGDNLAGTPFERSFYNERFIAQVTGSIATKTAAECAAYLAWIRAWIGQRIDNADRAARQLGLPS